MASQELKIIFGGGSFWTTNEEQTEAWLKTLTEVGIKDIDTAQSYGGSEVALGKAGAASKFNIDTKMSSGFGQEPATKDLVLQSGKESLEKLQTKQVGVYYLHAPDRRLPWEETLSGINELYKQGAFKRLGLSNFLGREVDEIVEVAKKNGFVVPSVYQGNYSAVARRADDEIFPTLRKHNIAFYAYSPIAGGFLSKSKAALTHKDGRFGKNDMLGSLYNGMYNKPSYLEALEAWEKIAEEEGASRAELAYRWTAYHSALNADKGDGIIIGASSFEQLKETIAAIKKGPLSKDAAKQIDAVWETVKADAPLDNFEGMAGAKFSH